MTDRQIEEEKRIASALCLLESCVRQRRRDNLREDFIEQLDKMFPDGYLIIYTCSDKQIRMSLFNPHKDRTIEKYHNILSEERRNE